VKTKYNISYEPLPRCWVEEEEGTLEGMAYRKGFPVLSAKGRKMIYEWRMRWMCVLGNEWRAVVVVWKEDIVSEGKRGFI